MLQDALASGAISMAVLPNGRAFNAAKTNPDIKAVFKDAITLYDNLVIPTGAVNVDAATAFLQYTARHATQLALAERFPMAPVPKAQHQNLVIRLAFSTRIPLPMIC